jgi:hypothetical protein
MLIAPLSTQLPRAGIQKKSASPATGPGYFKKR